MSDLDMKQIAVIMRAKDEMPYAPAALKSLREQNLKEVDLWAVDSGSTDGTLETLQRNVPPNRLVQIRPEEYVPGRVLNRMIERTDTPILVLQNADSIFQSRDALEKLVRPLKENQADATMCAQITRPDAKFIVTYDYLRAYDPANIKGDNADFFSAVTCAFRRDLWETARFPEQGYAEDVAWARICRKNGAQFRLVTDSVVEHSHNYTLRALYRKKFRHGVTFAREYGRRPDLLRQTAGLCKEWTRDLLYTVRKGRLDTLPYNIAYRAVIHTALYSGLKAGARG